MVKIRSAATVAALLLTAACSQATDGVEHRDPPSADRLVTPDSPESSPRGLLAKDRPLSACETATTLPGGQAVMIDYVDFVIWSGRQYFSGQPAYSAPSRSEPHLGRQVGTVRCTVSTLTSREKPGRLTDGDAAYLPVGTVLHEVAGFAPQCRLAAVIAGHGRVYLAHHDINGRSMATPCAKG